MRRLSVLLLVTLALAIPLRAQALVGEIVGDEVCVDVLSSGEDGGSCVPLTPPSIDLPF
jgi:hypothetical protein